MSLITGFVYVDELEGAKKVITKKGREIIPIILIPTPSSEYNDYMIKSDIPKDERDQGEKGAILGNAKIRMTGGNDPQKPF